MRYRATQPLHGNREGTAGPRADLEKHGRHDLALQVITRASEILQSEVVDENL